MDKRNYRVIKLDNLMRGTVISTTIKCSQHDILVNAGSVVFGKGPVQQL